jgi:hypothetical protein
VEVGDVFTDEVVNFGGGVRSPPLFECAVVVIAPLECGGDVADGCVEPDIPVIAGVIGDFEAEVGCWAGDVPIAEGLTEEVSAEVACDFGLKASTGLGPFFEEGVELFEFDEEVFGGADFGDGAGEHAAGVTEVRGCIGSAAGAAVITGLIRGIAAGAGSADESIGEEGTGDGIVELFDGVCTDESFLADGGPDLVAECAVFG